MRCVLLIIACLGTLACSSHDRGETARPAENPAPATVAGRDAVPDDRAAIVILGDSLAEGLGVGQGQAFPELIQRRLDERRLGYRIINLGVSGDTTTGGLRRLEHALSFKPSILMIELGGNDGLRGIPVASTKANLEKMIVAAQQAGAQVLLAGMTLPPNYGPEYIRSFEQAYKDLARQYKAQLIPFLMQDIATQLEERPGLMQRDGIHPSPEGHAVIAETVFRYLRPLLADRG